MADVHFVDVGQGDGIWIHTADDGIPGNGRFEGATSSLTAVHDSTARRVTRLHASAGADGAIIDALIITHPHDDHYPVPKRS